MMSSTNNSFIENFHKYTNVVPNSHLSWFLEITNIDLRQDLEAYAMAKRPNRFLIIFCLLITLICLPSEIYIFQDLLKIHSEISNIIFTFSFFFFSLTSIVSCWLLIIMKQRPALKPHDLLIRSIFSISITVIAIMRLYRYVLFPCDLHPISEIMIGRNCHYHDVNTLPWDTGSYLLAVPILILSIIKESRLWLAFLCFFSIFVAIGTLAFLYHPNTFSLLIFWGLIGGFLILDIHLSNISTYFLKRKLVESLVQTQTIQDETQAQEMRHMIANVAHDLKTPLSSFISGVDIIEQVLQECEQSYTSSSLTVETCYDKMRSIGQYLEDIRNTNSFMLMTINRCIDYTKASKGMKLVPRYETIDLLETLRLPLNCMRNIQNRIQICLNPIAKSICSHIITDKQWLQENILCLLSNAVKYSSGGEVTITVSLNNFKKPLTIYKDSNPMKMILTEKSIRRMSYNKISPETLQSRKEIQISADVYQMKIRESFLLDAQRHSSKSTHRPAVQVFPSPQTINNESLKESQTQYTQFTIQSKDSLKQKPELEIQYILFEVEDTGIGMSDEAMKYLFNPFKQNQRLAGGTGLGLYSLAKRVEALNGNYGVKKRKDGKQGSLFWFTIPYKPDDLIASMLGNNNNNNNNNNNEKSIHSLRLANARRTSCFVQLTRSSIANIAILQESSLHSFASNQNPQQNNESKITVLIVDDSPSILKMTSTMLKKQGFEVFTAENGAIAVQKIEDRWNTLKSVFELVIMDLQMPVMDGLEATRRIRKIEADFKLSLEEKRDNSNLIRPRQIIVGCSANSDSDTTDSAFDAGVDGFMAKPFSMDSFYTTANTLVSKLLH